MNPETFHALDGKLSRLAQRYIKMKRIPKRFEFNLTLNNSELHLLEMVAEKEGASLTALAGALGVTKGAVSQTLKRLIEKKLVLREVDPDNNTRIALFMTENGRSVCLQHKAWHDMRLDGGLLAMMNEFSEEEGQLLHRVFDRLNEVLDTLIKLNR